MYTLLDMAFNEPLRYVTILVVLVGSIVLHELGHAMVATWEGDATPRIRGHLTWNPVVHMGWVSLALIAIMGIGWGMTPVDRAAFRHRRWGAVLVSAAGPAVNLLLAFLAALILVLMNRNGVDGESATRPVTEFWLVLLHYNVLLFLFNMIPVPPLDGFSVLDGTFELGGLGDIVRRAGMFAFLIAILVLNSDAFDRVWESVTKAIVIGARILVGA